MNTDKLYSNLFDIIDEIKDGTITTYFELIVKLNLRGYPGVNPHLLVDMIDYMRKSDNFEKLIFNCIENSKEFRELFKENVIMDLLLQQNGEMYDFKNSNSFGIGVGFQLTSYNEINIHPILKRLLVLSPGIVIKFYLDTPYYKYMDHRGNTGKNGYEILEHIMDIYGEKLKRVKKLEKYGNMICNKTNELRKYRSLYN